MTDLATASNQARVLLSAWKGLVHLESIIDAAAKAEQVERECSERVAALRSKEAALANKIHDDEESNRDYHLASLRSAEDIIEQAKSEASKILREAIAEIDLRQANAEKNIALAISEAEKQAALAATTRAAVEAMNDELKRSETKLSDIRAAIAKYTGN